MSLQAVTLARKKAALTRHYGAEDPRTLVIAAQLRRARLARLAAQLLAEDHLSERERTELTALLAPA